ncbi:hypothetical protein ACJX0J_032119, partial [Zea mays]
AGPTLNNHLTIYHVKNIPEPRGLHACMRSFHIFLVGNLFINHYGTLSWHVCLYSGGKNTTKFSKYLLLNSSNIPRQSYF